MSAVCGDPTDPNHCTVMVRCPQPEARRLRKAVGRLLHGLDPTFQIISIIEETSLDGQAAVQSPEQYELFSDASVGTDLTSLATMAPSLAIGLFLHEKGTLSADMTRKHFKDAPWKFHHRVELSTTGAVDSFTPVAKQEYYEIRPREALGDTPWPLWSVSPVHFGNEHIRFTLFARDYARMVEFYRCLTGKEAESTRDGFCFFDMYSQPGLDIQLALKSASSLNPSPPQYCNLCITGRSLRDVLCLLDTDPVRMSRTRWMVRDPDGNHLVVEEAREPVMLIPRAPTPRLSLPLLPSHHRPAPPTRSIPRLAWRTSRLIKDLAGERAEESELSDTSSCCSFCRHMIDAGPRSQTQEQTGSFDSGFSGFSTRSMTSETGSGSELTLGYTDWSSDAGSTLTGVSSVLMCTKSTAL